MTTYHYRLYPTKNQETIFRKMLVVHVALYNRALAENRAQYEATKKGPSCFDQIKNSMQGFDRQGVNYSSLQQTIRRFHKSLKAFFRRKHGFPKPKEAFHTIEFGKHTDGWKFKDNQLYIQGLGIVKASWHRTMFGKPKHLTISRKPDGKIFISIVTDYVPIVPGNNGSSVGIDLGLKTFVVTSDGEKIKHPTPYLRKLKTIKRLRKQIKASKLNAKRLRKKKRALTKTHRKVSNQRADFLHKLSKSFVTKYGAIAVEDIKVKDFDDRPRRVNRKQRDVAWASFLTMLEYKSERQGIAFKRVNPAYTSQMCSSCGVIVPKTLKVRVHECSCGHVEDRDVNAAKNILRLGFGSGTTELGNDTSHERSVHA